MKNARIGGFTLIELAVVLVVLGLLAGAFFSAAAIQVKQKRAEAMTLRFNDIRIALADYIKDNPNLADDPVNYPCPASLTIAPGAAGFGEELCPPDYAAAAAGIDLGGVFVINGTTPGSLVLVGAVPTTTLDLSGDTMVDEYGNRFTYAVSLDLTEDDVLLQRPVPAGEISVVDQNGNVKASNADFIVLSHGEDASGAYSAQGLLAGDCRTTEIPGDGDTRNCLWQTTFEAVFRDQKEYGLSMAANDTYFDDQSVYTLGEDEGWWQTTGGAGSNIISKNPANIGIGPGISNPVQRLDIDGAIKVSNTANTCNAASVGSIRYNDGTQAVVECCNGNASDGYAWSDITYGCASGECTPANVGQQRFNTETGLPEFCNGDKFVPIAGAPCEDEDGTKYHHLQKFDEEEAETEDCPKPDYTGGTRTRLRDNQMMCNNSEIELISNGEYGTWDESGCLNECAAAAVVLGGHGGGCSSGCGGYSQTTAIPKLQVGESVTRSMTAWPGGGPRCPYSAGVTVTCTSDGLRMDSFYATIAGSTYGTWGAFIINGVTQRCFSGSVPARGCYSPGCSF